MPDATISVVCPTCFAKMKAPAKALGKKSQCPKCLSSITIAQEGLSFAPEPPASPPLPSITTQPWNVEAAKPSPPKAANVEEPDAKVDEVREERNTHPSQPKSQMKMVVNVGELKKRVLMLFGVVAVLCIILLVANEVINDTPQARFNENSKTHKSNKLTRENYLRIYVGMSYSDVKLILGQPTKILNQNASLSEPVIYEYDSGGAHASIVVSSDGQVMGKTQRGLD